MAYASNSTCTYKQITISNNKINNISQYVNIIHL